MGNDLEARLQAVRWRWEWLLNLAFDGSPKGVRIAEPGGWRRLAALKLWCRIMSVEIFLWNMCATLKSVCAQLDRHIHSRAFIRWLLGERHL
mgnify:CR=1 FL=1